MDIDDPYLAFIFDEALLFIEGMIKGYDSKGLAEWTKEPFWWEDYLEVVSPKPKNNSELFNALQSNLKKFS